MEIIYRAFDGTEFDDELECERYETEKNLDFSLVSLCIFADEDGNKMKTPTTLQELYNTFENCAFWYIPEEAEEIAGVLDDRGFYTGPLDGVNCCTDIIFDGTNLGSIIKLARNLAETFPMLNQENEEG